MDFSLLGFEGFKQVLNLHPVFVHFPIALFPASLLFFFIGILWRKPSLEIAGRACLVLAILGTFLAVITGQMASNSIPHNEAIHRIMMPHQKIGFASLILGLLLTAWSFVRKAGLPRLPKIFLIFLALQSLMILQNGDLGVRMVFVEGAGVKPALPLMEPGHPHGEPGTEEDPDHHHHEH